MSDNMEQIKAELELTEVLFVSSDDYEWDGFGAWRNPAGRYFWFTDAGCSCNWFADGIESASELSDGTLEDLERAFRVWAKSAREIGHVNVIDTIAKLREKR